MNCANCAGRGWVSAFGGVCTCPVCAGSGVADPSAWINQLAEDHSVPVEDIVTQLNERQSEVANGE